MEVIEFIATLVSVCTSFGTTLTIIINCIYQNFYRIHGSTPFPFRDTTQTLYLLSVSLRSFSGTHFPVLGSDFETGDREDRTQHDFLDRGGCTGGGTGEVKRFWVRGWSFHGVFHRRRTNPVRNHKETSPSTPYKPLGRRDVAPKGHLHLGPSQPDPTSLQPGQCSKLRYGRCFVFEVQLCLGETKVYTSSRKESPYEKKLTRFSLGQF